MDVDPERVVLDVPLVVVPPDADDPLAVLVGAPVVDDPAFVALLLQPLRTVVHRAMPSTAEAPSAPLRIFTR